MHRRGGYNMTGVQRLGLGAARIGIAMLAATSGVSRAQILLPEPPAEIAAADILERRGETIDLDTEFTDQTGRRVHLRDYFDGDRPVVLVFGYFTCPVVCPVVFNNTQTVFNELAWTLGKEYRAVTVSFDHSDTPSAAANQREVYLRGVDRAAGDDPWPFLTGSAEEIRKLTESAGWQFKYLPATGDFSHPTGIIIASPDGVVSNYLYGVRYEERQLRLALLDASDGRIGDVFDRILLRCYHYDPDAGSYVLAARKVMTYAGSATVIILGSVIFALVRVDRHRTRAAHAGAAGASDANKEQADQA